METTNATHKPTRTVHSTPNAALWAQHDRSNALAGAVDAIRAWRHLQPHGDATNFAVLDAVLDSVAVGDDAPVQRLKVTTLAEAVAAHRQVMEARSRALEAVRLVWDQIEAASMRTIDQHMPGGRA